MRRVERSENAPERLVEKGAEELGKAELYFGPPRKSPKSFGFKTYKINEVKRALERIFHGKCAYCETYYSSTQPMDVEHYRPKGAVFEDQSHTGYWWEAMKWDNLLPSCIDCNRKRYQPTPEDDGQGITSPQDQLGVSQLALFSSGKKDRFPLAATGQRALLPGEPLSAEKPLLLNPCNDDPNLHLEYYFDEQHPVSFIMPRTLAAGVDDDFRGENGLSSKGRASIDIYGFNRLGLVQARTEILRQLMFLESVIVELSTLAQKMDDQRSAHSLLAESSTTLMRLVDRIVEEMARMAAPEAPYAAMVSAWLVGFSKRFS